MATRYGTKTRLSAGEVLKKTVAYFGPDGLGLRPTRRTLTGIRLEGGGGYVEVEARPGRPTQVDLVLHQWEQHAAEFMRSIKK